MSTPPVDPNDFLAQLDQMVTERVQQALGFPTPVQTSPAQPEEPDEGVLINFQDVLDSLDPRDSEASMAMYAWLTKYGRLHRVGTLDGGLGHLFQYVEPKGTTKEGYVAGGTKGDQIVDQALSQAQAANGGAEPAQQGLCKHCLSVIKQAAGGGKPFSDDDPTHTVCAPNGNGQHEFA